MKKGETTHGLEDPVNFTFGVNEESETPSRRGTRRRLYGDAGLRVLAKGPRNKGMKHQNQSSLGIMQEEPKALNRAGGGIGE